MRAIFEVSIISNVKQPNFLRTINKLQKAFMQHQSTSYNHKKQHHTRAFVSNLLKLLIKSRQYFKIPRRSNVRCAESQTLGFYTFSLQMISKRVVLHISDIQNIPTLNLNRKMIATYIL
jgi:hypothetical protein